MSTISKARDGDGDGFVYDGTPGQRPVRPGDISRRLTSMSVPEALASDHVTGASIPPREADEPEFAWQSRVLKTLPPDVVHDVLAKARERTTIVDYIANGETEYRRKRGLPEPNIDWDSVTASRPKAQLVVRAIEQHQGDPRNDPRARAAYDDFRRQNDEMYDFLTNTLGVKVDIWDERTAGRDDPYETAEAQAQDLQVNKHLWVNRGEFFIGDTPDSPTGTDHPFMNARDYERFRAVHDAFGHAGVGGGFDRHGEYEAWIAHNSMYTGEGRKAMSTEYHGVNSYLWVTGTPMPHEKFGMLLPDNLIQNVFDENGDVVRKSTVDEIVAKLGLTPESVTRFDNVYEMTRHHHVLGPLATFPSARVAKRDDHGPNKKSSVKEIVGHHGHRPHGHSILWPALYEHLRAKGYSKEKAARISNAAWNKKKAGLPTNAPTSARGLAKVSPEAEKFLRENAARRDSGQAYLNQLTPAQLRQRRNAARSRKRRKKMGSAERDFYRKVGQMSPEDRKKVGDFFRENIKRRDSGQTFIQVGKVDPDTAKLKALVAAYQKNPSAKLKKAIKALAIKTGRADIAPDSFKMVTEKAAPVAMISKLDDAKQNVFGWAYVANDHHGELVVDKSGDFIDELHELEEAAYTFVLESRQGGADHRRNEDGPVVVSKMIESFVVTPEKLDAMGVPDGILPNGAWWTGFHIEDPEVWEGVKNGSYTMFSVHGTGVREPV